MKIEGLGFRAVGVRSSKQGYLRWTPHPVKMTIMDNKEYIRVLD